MSKIARIYQGTNEIQKYYQGGVLQRLFFDWKHYIGNELNIEYAKECAGRNVVISGKTYQNLVSNLSDLVGKVYTLKNNAKVISNLLRASTTYTFIVSISEANYSFRTGAIIVVNYPTLSTSYISISSQNGIFKIKYTVKEEIPKNILISPHANNDATSSFKLDNLIILEGDYTKVDLPTSIDGIESVGEREENLVNTATIYKSMIESGTIGSLFNPKADSQYDVYKMEIQPNTEYLFNLVGYGQSPWIRIFDKNNITVKLGNLQSSGLSYIWSLKTESNFYYLVFNKPKTSKGTFRVYKKENPYPLKLAVNEEINFINLPIPLRSLPNGTCDTVEGNKLVQRVGKVVLDGSENWSISSINNNENGLLNIYCSITDVVSKDHSKQSFVCDKYIQQTTLISHTNTEGVLINIEKRLYLRLFTSKATTVAEAKEYIKNNPFIVYYELETPIETEITPDMILINGEPITDTVGIELPNGTKDSIENDYYVKRVGKVIIDGKNGRYQRSGTSTSTLDVYVVRYLGINITLKGLNTNYIYQCDSKIDMSKYITVGKWLGDSTSGSVVFKVPTEEYLWSDIFNAFLENPITLYVELATPVKIPLFSIKEGLTTLKSTNNITPQIELDCLVRDDFQNMCDNVWESGDIDYATGVISDKNSSRIRLINYIKVKPNAIYRIDIVNKSRGESIGLRNYDISKNYINSESGDIGKISKAPLYFTTPEDCYYIRFIVETKDINFKIYLKEVIE